MLRVFQRSAVRTGSRVNGLNDIPLNFGFRVFAGTKKLGHHGCFNFIGPDK